MSSIESGPSARLLDQGNHLNEAEIQRIVEYYAAQVARRTQGPQLEGIESNSLELALRTDPNILLLDVYDDSGELIKWPLLTPIEHHIDYSQKFFKDHYPEQKSYSFTLPPYSVLPEILADSDIFIPIAERLKAENAIIAYDYLNGSKDELLIQEFLQAMAGDTASIQDITPESVQGGRSYGLPQVVHFEAYAGAVDTSPTANNIHDALRQMEGRGEIGDDPESGVAYLTPEKLRAEEGALLKEIWSIYSEQFDILTEDHPSLQKQPQEELERMLLSDDAVNIAYMENGKVAGLLYFVHDMESCVWLNKKFYDERYDEKEGWLAYYPGIVVAKEYAQRGAGYAQAMMGSVAEAVKATAQEMIITCQCTNISLTYVPKIAASVINSYPGMEIFPNEQNEDFTRTAEYNYRIMQVD